MSNLNKSLEKYYEDNFIDIADNGLLSGVAERDQPRVHLGCSTLLPEPCRVHRRDLRLDRCVRSLRAGMAIPLESSRRPGVYATPLVRGGSGRDILLIAPARSYSAPKGHNSNPNRTRILLPGCGLADRIAGGRRNGSHGYR